MSNLKALKLNDLLDTSMVITRRKRSRKSPAEFFALRKEVEKLARIFIGSESPVYFAGGLAMALHQKEFYRNHKDFDLSIFVEDLPGIARHLEFKGYQLVARYFTTHISSGHNMQLVAPLDIRRISKEDPGTIRVRGMIKRRIPFCYVDERQTFFDIFFQSKMPDGVFLHWPKVTVPWDDYMPATPVLEGSALMLPNLNFKKYLPPTMPRQFIDFKKANFELDPEPSSG